MPLVNGSNSDASGYVQNNLPVNPNDIANKSYTDLIAAGFTSKSSCFVSTTANLNASYTNGAAGVGAQLTNAGPMAAFSSDGQSPPINSRILVQFQTIQANNGIYQLSTVGSGVANWVLTRTTDYDQPSEIVPGTLVPVVNGTLYAGTFWVETSTVTTIGVDSITFTQFGSTAITLPISSSDGGTGVSAPAAHTIPVAEGTSNFTFLGPLTSGQILIGSTGADPVPNTLSAGTGISILNGAGMVTISASATALTFDGDTGFANPVGGIININGTAGQGISTSASGNSVVITAATSTTSQLGVVELATGAQAIAGTDAANAVTSSALGAKLGALTLHGVALGEGSAAALAYTSAGTSGQVLTGVTGADPSFASVGTNSGLTTHGVLLAEGASAFVATSVGLTGQVLTGTTAADPAFAAIGTGSGLSAHGILLAEGAGAFVATAPLTNGQLLIGSTGVDPVPASLTAGSGITITPASGAITIAATVSATTYNEDLGSATPSGGILNINGTSAQGISTSGTGSTVTITASTATTAQKGTVLLASNAQAIAGTDTANAVTSAALSAKLGSQTAHGVALGETSTSALSYTTAGTLGQVLSSNGSSVDPAFAALGVNSGLTVHGVVIAENNSAFVALTPGAAGLPLVSGGVAADPSFAVLGVVGGGTGLATLTAHSVLLGEGTSTVAFAGPSATVGTILQSAGSTADPTFSTASYPSTTTINQLLYSSATNVVGGLATANSSVLATTSAGVPGFLGPLTNGQVIIGSTGATPVAATLTGGNGVTVVNTAGVITINAPLWTSIVASQAMVAGNGYIVSGGALSLSLPTTAVVGSMINVLLAGGTSFTLTQAAGQQIFLASSSSTVGVTGTVSSSANGDSINLVCTTANNTWFAYSFNGNFLIV